MNSDWQWLIPVLTFITGGLGGYYGASGKVVVLEMRILDLLKWKDKTDKSIQTHNEDLLVHDIEIQTLMNNANLPRARRQLFREEDV